VGLSDLQFVPMSKPAIDSGALFEWDMLDVPTSARQIKFGAICR
jgi:hypothetical protein